MELARSIEVGVSVPEADDAPGKQPVALGTPDPKAGEDMANASPPDEETVLQVCTAVQATSTWDLFRIHPQSPCFVTWQGFLLESLENGAEGLMVKQLDRGAYEPSKRSESWLKVKPQTPCAAWHGVSPPPPSMSSFASGPLLRLGRRMPIHPSREIR